MKNLIKHQVDVIYSALILLSSVIFVFDFFRHAGRPATFDALFHITNIVQFTTALRSGDFPVYWENGFANFGLPIGIVAHQIPSYLGAAMNLLLNDPTLSYNILVFLGIFLSALFFYYFLRQYFSATASFIGAILFNFAPYRILNAYIRGAEPEIFSNIFVPLILISIYQFVIKRKFNWFFPFVIFLSLLALTHPMNLLIYSLIIGPYFLFCLWQAQTTKRQKIKDALILIFGGFLSLGIAAYYLIPLTVEIRYFYIGLSKNQLAPNHFLGADNFFMEKWMYESVVDKITRAQTLQTGILETAVFLLGLISLVLHQIKKRKLEIVHLAVLSGLLIVFFATSPSNIIYQLIPPLGNIQYPWRMLNGFIFIPPIITAYYLTKKPKVTIIASGLIVLFIFLIRFPQLYGKNFKIYPESIYSFNQMNVHSDLMNTVWADYPQNYPRKTSQFQIIGGEGKVVVKEIKNSSRRYSIEAKTPMKMIDNTFYFPGWKAYVDNNPTTIQFQDGNYRGLIEYEVPAGKHIVHLVFGDSIVRLFGRLVSIVSLLLIIVLVGFRRKIIHAVDKL